MFRQIEVKGEGVHYQAIVWCFSENDRIEIYYLLTVTYGLGSSAWQTIRTIRQIILLRISPLKG